MMSAAILMAGAELATVRPVSADRGETEGLSFAQSFDKSAGDAASLPEDKLAGEAGPESSSLKGTAPIKPPTAGVEAPVEVQGKVVVALVVSGHGVALKSAVTDKISQARMVSVTDSHLQRPAEEVDADAVELPPQMDTAAETDLAATAISHSVPANELTGEEDAPPVNVATGGGPVVQRVVGSVVHGSIEVTGETKDVASPKQAVKAQESAASPKILKKSVDPVLNAVAVESKPTVGSPTEGTIPLGLGQAAASDISARIEIGKIVKGFESTVTVVGKPFVGGATAPVDSVARRELAYGEKAVATDIEVTLPAAVEMGVSPKAGVGPEKMAVVAMASGSDGDGRMQSLSGPAAALVHAMSGGAVVPSGIGFCVGERSNAPPDLSATKIQVGDSAIHTAGFPSGSSESQGAGVGMSSIEDMPRMLTATPTSLEVGIQNGTHGWLKIRAEMADGGVVNASVSAASSVGQEMLHRELPALTAYLQDEKVAVNAVVVHAPLGAGNDGRSSSGMDSAGGQTSQRSDQGNEQRQNFAGPISDDSDETTTYRGMQEGLQVVDGDGLLPLAGFGSGGGWLSVRA
jgi:hypothetical protein